MRNSSACLLVFALFILAGCSSSKPRNPRFINTPSAYNPSFFQKKGDSKVSFNGTFGAVEVLNGKNITEENGAKTTLLPADFSSGFDVETGYAFTDHFFMTLGMGHYNEADYFFDNDITMAETKSSVNYRKTMYDIGLGYYTPLSEGSKVYFNAIGGYRFGPMKSEIEGGGTMHYFNGRANKVYIAPGFNFFFSPYFRMAVAPQFSFLKYNNINISVPLKLKDFQLFIKKFFDILIVIFLK